MAERPGLSYRDTNMKLQAMRKARQNGRFAHQCKAQ